MTNKIRQVNLPEDYETISTLLSLNESLFGREKISVEALIKEDENIPVKDRTSFNDQGMLTGFCRERLVAVSNEDKVIGFASGWRTPFAEPGGLASKLIVHPDFRKRGVGSQLLIELEAWGKEKGASFLLGEVPDHELESNSFSSRRGYQTERHLYQSTLDITTFNADAFDSVLEEVKLSGIHFEDARSVNDVQLHTEIFNLFKKTLWDNPAMTEDDIPEEEEWKEIVSDFPEGMILAKKDGKYIGMTILIPREGNKEWFNDYTGVDRDYRRMHVALSLKLTAIQLAQSFKIEKMRTDNDSLNVPMLAINKKLGYQVSPGGHYRVRKKIK
ncbi:GNAT family N-acetyltransferase [Pseudalkalibacillus caeni]|uniref:GNAT family N-acetyltransferase n=1 Tax=Exobacillus caeni TaxID=2574798 RepID=A0A5R9F5S8_9BACL|nr:GNAT family N-acetyltransferase [Pseudalkalibacillus caeni]TLS36988.1 GNAT family N-acetyltransferase [Pseudalkalibacillus caeni]